MIETGSPLCAIDDVLSLQLQLPDAAHLVACTAVVRHTYGDRGLGVEFTNLTEESRDRLRRLSESDAEPKAAPPRKQTQDPAKGRSKRRTRKTTKKNG